MRRLRRGTWGLVLLLSGLSGLFLCGGCGMVPKIPEIPKIPGVTGPVVKAAQLLKYRALDALDMFEAGVEAGPGWRVDAKYGLGIFGMGEGKARMFRLGQRPGTSLAPVPRLLTHPRSFHIAWEEFAPVPFPAGLPVVLVVFPFVSGEGRADPLWLVLLIGAEAEKEGRSAYLVRREVHRGAFMASTPEKNLWRKSFAVGAEVMLGLGARARVYPIEVLDFLLGFAGWDLLKDDSAYPSYVLPTPISTTPSSKLPPADSRVPVKEQWRRHER